MSIPFQSISRKAPSFPPASTTNLPRLCGAEAIQETQQQGGSVSTNLPATELDQVCNHDDKKAFFLKSCLDT